MPRLKRTSATLNKAEQKLLSFKASTPSLSADEDLSPQEVIDLASELRQELDGYNTKLTDLDSAKANVDRLEKLTSEALERLVNGVAYKYGKDSREYEMIGGVRKSDRVRKATQTRLKKRSASPNAS